MSPVLNMPGLGIWQGFEYARVTKSAEYAKFFFEKKTLAQVFSCEFYEISKNAFSTEQLWTTASGKVDFVDIIINEYL